MGEAYRREDLSMTHVQMTEDKKCIVCDKNHKVIRRFKNLGGLHRFVSKRWKESIYSMEANHPASVHLYKNYKEPDIKPYHTRHKLLILFENLDYAYVFFCDYTVMKEHVARWRNLRGLPVHEYCAHAEQYELARRGIRALEEVTRNAIDGHTDTRAN